MPEEYFAPSIRRRSILFLFALLAAVNDAQSWQEEEAFGLVATYRWADRQVMRIDEDVQFEWGDSSPDLRIPHGTFSVRWHGQVFVVQPGDHTFYLHLEGKGRCSINGEVVVEANSPQRAWVAGKPISLSFGLQNIEVEFEKTTSSARIALYWSSTSFEREPIPSERLTHPPQSDANDAELSVMARRCSSCHDLPRESLASPSLDGLAPHLNPGWFVHTMTKTESPRHPVRYAISSEDATDIELHLLGDAKPAPRRFTGGNAENGQKLVESLGCLACHRIDEVGWASMGAGGDLTRIAEKRPPDFFDRWLSSPESINPDHRMPTFPLEKEERRDIARYLQTLGKPLEHPAIVYSAERAEHGRQLFDQYRCSACHRREGHAPPIKLPRPTFRQGMGCLQSADANQSRPGYAEDESTQAGLRRFIADLPREQSDLAVHRRGWQVMAKNNCLACHPRGASTGLRSVAEELGVVEPRAVAVLVAPSLTQVGDKLADDWLMKAVGGEAPRRRSWLNPRMPRYVHSDADRSALVSYLVQHDRIPPVSAPADRVNDMPASKSEAVEQRAAAGKLLGPAGFGCLSCHAVGDVKPVGVEPAAMGPDLRKLEQRINPIWFKRWVNNPSRIVPGIEMPAINRPIPGVLGENLPRQIDALWEGLNADDFIPPAIDAVQSLTALGKSRPIILRDIFEHSPGDETTRPLAIGLTNGHSLLIDLNTLTVRRWWVGDFADQRTKGKSWYWRSAGTTIGDWPKSTPFLLLEREGQLVPPTSQGQAFGWIQSWRHDRNAVEAVVRVKFTDIEVDFQFRFEPTKRGLRVSIESLAAPPAGTSFVLTPPVPDDSPWMTSLGSAKVIVTRAENIDTKRAGILFRKSVAWEVSLGSDVTPISTIRVLPTNKSSKAELPVLPGYIVERLPMPDGPMPTAMAELPDGSLLVTSLKGQVSRAVDTDHGGDWDEYQPYADDLAAPFGILVDSVGVLVGHKHELLRLKDDDGDQFAERAEVVSSGWGVTADYHDWMVGPFPAGPGRYYLALSCQQDERSAAESVGRGKVVVTRPDGGFDVFAAGVRFPMGLAVNKQGDLFASDNQGVTNPFNEINHIRLGKHYGFFGSNESRADQKNIEPAAIQIPHPWTGSVNGLAFVPDGGKFGPFDGQLIGAEYTTRRLIRMSLQKVGDTYQGCVYPFSLETDADPSTGFLGPIALCFTADGSLCVGSMIDSGWGGGNNRGAIERVRFTGPLPLGIREVRATHDGFEIDFTEPIDPALAEKASMYTISSYRRIHTVGYATPDRDRKPVRVTGVEVSADAQKVSIRIDPMRPGFVYDIAVGSIGKKVTSLYPNIAYYSLNALPAQKN